MSRDDVDLTAGLAGLERAGVTVVTPAAPVVLDHHAGHEVIAAVRAALDNVAEHAGDGAEAWVLLEGSKDGVRVTVRDNGAGLPPGRLEEAAGEGRLGAVASIRGRIEDLGGKASWTSRDSGACPVALDAPVTRPGAPVSG